MAKTKVRGEYLKDSVVRFTAKAGENITKGNAVYISGISGEVPVVSLADADDANKMPCFGLAEATVSTNAEVDVISYGSLKGLNTSSFSLGDILFIGTTAGALTNDPAGLEATKLQNIGIVQRVHASNGAIKVGGAGRTNAVPNLDNGDIFIGNSDNKAVSSALSTEIESYLDGGTSTPTFASATVSTASSGATAAAGGDELVIENSSTAGMSILSGTANDGNILFGDSGNSAIGYMQYKHSVNALVFGTNGSEVARFDSSGNFGIGTGAPDANLQIRGSGDRSLAITSGTAGAAILNFGDTTSGDFDIGSIIYDNANNSMQFKVNNSERLRIDSSGRVSIGTTSTNAPLRVKVATDANFTVQNTSSTVQLQAINDAGNAFTTLDIAGNPIKFSANGSESMRLTTTGLDVLGNITVGTNDSIFAENNIRFKSAGAAYIDHNTVGQDINFRVSNASSLDTTALTIDSSGKVGIGDSSPSALLQVGDGATVAAGTSVTTAVFNQKGNWNVNEYEAFKFGISEVRSVYQGGNAWRYSVLTGSASSRTERLSIDGAHGETMVIASYSGGTYPFRVGYGSYASFTPTFLIDDDGSVVVNATSQRAGLAEAHYFVGSSSNSGSAPFTVYNDSGTANCPALNVMNRDESVDSSNRFIQFWANVTSNTAQAMGGIVGNSATNAQFATLSDEREKENITPVTGILDKVMNLNVVSFDWKFNDEHVKAGFIAQNVEEHFPEYVIENVSLEGEEPRKGTTGGMSAGYIAVLTKAIQEQQEQIESLKSEIELLKGN